MDISWSFVTFSGEQGLVEEAQKALEEAEALKKVLFLLKIKKCFLGLWACFLKQKGFMGLFYDEVFCFVFL